MRKVRITVLKTTLDEELAAEYGTPGLETCPFAQNGTGILCRLCQTGGLM